MSQNCIKKEQFNGEGKKDAYFPVVCRKCLLVYIFIEHM